MRLDCQSLWVEMEEGKAKQVRTVSIGSLATIEILNKQQELE